VPKLFRHRPKPIAPTACSVCEAPLELVSITNLLAERSDEYLTCTAEPQKHPQLRAVQYLTTSLPTPSYRQIRVDSGFTPEELIGVKVLDRRR
jgi:hypothetical protein